MKRIASHAFSSFLILVILASFLSTVQCIPKEILSLAPGNVVHQAPSFWVEPDTETFQTATTPLGSLFNVTVWGAALNHTVAWQCGLGFSSLQLQAVNAGYSAGNQSQLFAGHNSFQIGFKIDNDEGLVLCYGETLLDSDYLEPRNASLFWITFKITAAPAFGTSLTSLIDPGYIPQDTSFFNDNMNEEGGLSTASCTYTYNGAATLSLTALTDKTVYRRQETVLATAKLLSGQMPIIGTPVSLQVDFPNGTAWFLWTNTTDSEGTSTFQFLLPKTCPLGEYNVYASAYKPGVGNTSATTQFTILNEPPKVISVETLPGVVEQPTTVTVRANATDYEDGTNIKVKCIVTIPNGTAQEHTMVFDGTYFTFHYPLQRTDPIGTYGLLVQAEDSEGSLSDPFHSSFENSISTIQGAVNVQVIDSKQNPVSSVDLLLRKTDSYLVYNGSTDQDGRFSFLKVVAGTYILEASASEFAQTSTQLEVFADVETSESLVLQRLPILQGYVKSAHNMPIQNATVEVWSPQKPAGEASTDENGAYRITVLVEGTCEVTASAYGYAQSSLDLSLQFETTTIANFTLSQNGAVEGQVKDSFSGQPIANASVYIGKQEYLGTGNSTDQYGNFSFSDVLPDNYLLRVVALGYQANSTQVNVTSGQTSYATIWLAPTGNINGTVRNSLTNEPISGASISLADDKGRVLTTLLSDQNGTYTFASIPPATYVLAAYASGYNSTFILTIVNPYDTVQDDVYLTPNNIFVALMVSPLLCSRGETVHFELTVTDSQNQSLADNITQAGILMFGPNNESISVPTSRIGESFIGDYQVPPTATLGIWTVLGNMTDTHQNMLRPVGLMGIAEAFYITFASLKKSYVSTENAEFQATVARYGNLTKLLGQNEVNANLTITDENGRIMANLSLTYGDGIFSGEQPLTTFGTGTYTAQLTINDPKGNVMTESLTFQVGADFSITLNTDQPAYNRTQSIKLFGYVEQTGGTSIDDAQVLLSLEVKGFARAFATLTNGSGYYEFTFTPSGFDAGNYTAKVVVTENNLERNASLAFTVLGLMLKPLEQTVNMGVNSNMTLTFNITNIGQSVLTELEASAVSSDPSLKVTLATQLPSTLSPGDQSQAEFLLTANSGSPTVCVVGFSIRSLEGAVESGRIMAYLYPAVPVALVEPELIEVSMNPGSYYMKQVNITNIGYGQMTNVSLTNPSLSWVSLTASEFGSIDPGESKLFDLILQPSENLSIGVYTDEVDVLSDNYGMVPIYLVVTITPNATGALIFNVQDDQGNRLTGVYVMLQYLEYYTDTLSGTTNATGALLFTDLPTGQYNYVVSMDGYSTVSDTATVYPGEPSAVNISLYTDMMDVSFTVEPIKIQDQYFVTLNFTYQTEIPPPFLLPVPPVLDYYADRAYVFNNGYSSTQQFTILNTGIIEVSNITLQTVQEPNTTGYHLSFQNFGDTITVDSLEAKSTTQIPVTVTVDPGIMITNLTDGLVGKIAFQGTFTYFDKGSDVPRSAITKGEVLVYVLDAGMRRLGIDPPIIYGFNFNGVLDIEFGTWPQRLDQNVIITNLAQTENVTLYTIAIGGELTLSLGFEISPENLQIWPPVGFDFTPTFGVITPYGSLPGEIESPINDNWLVTVNVGGGPLYSLLFQWFEQRITGKLNPTIQLSPQEAAVLQSENWELPSGSEIFTAILGEMSTAKLKLGADVSLGAIMFFYDWEYSKNWNVGIIPIVLVDVYAPKISISFPIQPSGIGGGESSGGGVAGWQPPQIVYPPRPNRPVIKTVTPTIIDGVHETVKLSVSQNATLERDAFLASLTMKNKLASTPIRNVNVTLKIDYVNGSDASSNFYVTPANLQNIDSIDGEGTLKAAQTASARWTIIPKPGAGGSDDNGMLYHVQAQILYTVNGTPYTINSTVESITVKPQPLLVLDYYVPSQVKANTPFKLAVKVTNVGEGTAYNICIDSAQPVIYENIAKLLVDFTILGSAVKGQPAGNSLKINFGDIPQGTSKIAYWLMECSLDGEFINFTASFTHANALGGAETSLIKTPINTHILMRDVMKDNVTFLFLVDTNNDGTPDEVVDPIFASGTPVVNVNYTVQYSVGTMILLTQKYENKWIWIDVDDPYNNAMPILQVTRSDGKILNPMNYWMANDKIYLVDDPEEEYTIVFATQTLGIVLLSPQNQTYHSSLIPLTFSVSEPTLWMGYSLDDQLNVTISGNTTISVGIGQHKIVIYAKGVSGSTASSETIYFTVKHTTACNVVNGDNAILDRFTGGPHPETVTLSVEVQDNVTGTYLAGQGLVKFYVNGVLVGTDNDTDGNQIYEIAWNPQPSWQTLGNQTWDAIFMGTSEYDPSSASSALTIHGQLYSTLLSPNGEFYKPGDTVQIVSQVTSDSPVEGNITGCTTIATIYDPNGSKIVDIPLLDSNNEGVYTTQWILQPGITDGLYTIRIVSSKQDYHDGILSPTGAFSADSTPPKGSITINNGSTYTTAEAVELELNYLDAGSGVSKVRYSNDGTWDTELWENPIKTRSWNLTAGDGTKTVYYQIKDEVGLLSPTYQAEIILDNTPPTTSLMIGNPSCVISGNLYVAAWTSFTLSRTDAGSGVAGTAYRMRNATYSSGWLTYTTPFTVAGLATGAYSVDYNSTDNLGNVETMHTQNVILNGKATMIGYAKNEIQALILQVNGSPIGKMLKNYLVINILTSASSQNDLAFTLVLNGRAATANGALMVGSKMLQGFMSSVMNARAFGMIPPATAAVWLTAAQTIINDINTAIARP